MVFGFAADHRVTIKESEKINKLLDLARELKSLRNIKVTILPIVVSVLEMVAKDLKRRQEVLRLSKGAGRDGNRRTSRDHPSYNIVKIGQNTEKSSGDLEKLAVTQTSMKNHQLR